ncbi:MAG: MFS transporter [Coriobacteriales bacterium]|nr:MFS transporter [Coriobacteriales bacterium]
MKKQISNIEIILLIAIISAAPPIATDLYLPAVPSMPAYFDTSEAVINFTLVGFFLFMAVGMLIFGPLSDKYGRKKPLLVSVFMFVVCAIFAATAINIWILVATRVLQGIAGGGMVALGTALVKDCFEGVRRQRTLVVVQAISVVAPVVSPILGAAIISFFDWRATFIAQGIIAALSLIFALRLIEPLPKSERNDIGVIKSIARLGIVGKNIAFTGLLICCAICGGPFMTYISAASYIYIDFFSLSPVEYSIYFGINASLSAVGAFLVIALQGKLTAKMSIIITTVLCILSGGLIIAFGELAPIGFLLTFAIYSLSSGFIRPIATNLLLEQQDKDTGSASSLINLVFTLCGSICMFMVSAPWSTYVFAVGFMVLVGSILSLLGIFALLKSKIEINGLN